MNSYAIAQYIVFLSIVVVLARPTGLYMARVFNRERTPLDRIWQGVPCNLAPATVVRTLDGPVQVIAQGHVAPLAIIENLGTNGGGFFNANGAHPYDNPTPLTNLMEMLAIVISIPALALADRFARQRRRATTAASLRTDTPLFGAVVVGTALILCGLCFLPAPALGPVVEHIHMVR